MKLLIAEDDAFFRRLLQQILAPDYDVVLVEDGTAAWEALRQPGGPQLAILDWVMPGLSGPQVCRRVRECKELAGICYLIILTAKNSSADVLSGLRAGADDYVTKPFDPEELRARVRLGQKIAQLQSALLAQSAALDDAVRKQQELLTLLPVCPKCRRIRADDAYWSEVRQYLEQHAPAEEATINCPVCADLLKIGELAVAAGEIQ